MIKEIQINKYLLTFDKPIRSTLFKNKLKKLDLFVFESLGKERVILWSKDIPMEIVLALPDEEHVTIEKL